MSSRLAVDHIFAYILTQTHTGSHLRAAGQEAARAAVLSPKCERPERHDPLHAAGKGLIPRKEKSTPA
eukprot:1137495-Pelagomonas_calceolata.AAC.3